MDAKLVATGSANAKWLMVLFVLGCCILSRAESARDILNRAETLRKSGTYQAVLANRPGKVFQRANPDGTVYIRMEMGGDKDSIMVKNSGGTFYLYPDSKQAVREADNDKPEPNFDKYAIYTMSEGEYEKIPCYIITREIPISDKTFKIFQDWSPGADSRSTSESRKIFKNNFGTKEIFWIAKENNVIYAIAKYNSTGKFLMEQKYSKVDLDPSLSDDLFEIPAGYAIQRCYDGQDFAETTGNIMDQEAAKERAQIAAANQPGFWSTLPQLPGRALSWTWEWLLAYGSWVFGAIGIGVVIVIGVMKWQEKSKVR